MVDNKQINLDGCQFGAGDLRFGNFPWGCVPFRSVLITLPWGLTVMANSNSQPSSFLDSFFKFFSSPKTADDDSDNTGDHKWLRATNDSLPTTTRPGVTKMVRQQRTPEERTSQPSLRYGNRQFHPALISIASFLPSLHVYGRFYSPISFSSSV